MLGLGLAAADGSDVKADAKTRRNPAVLNFFMVCPVSVAIKNETFEATAGYLHAERPGKSCQIESNSAHKLLN